MNHRKAYWLMIVVGIAMLGGCATQEKPIAQTPAFGEPVSTIPWNQPQKWEGGGAGLNALRNGQDN